MKKTIFMLLGLSLVLQADFSRSNDGIVTDNVTGLQWQDDYSDNSDAIKQVTWTDAIDYCESLTLGGYSDWRLPNKKELLSIVDYGQYDPSINRVFTKTTSYNYWSSTTHASLTGDVWIVYFSYGGTDFGNKSYPNYVRCVR
jgi:hypothetical protein